MNARILWLRVTDGAADEQRPALGAVVDHRLPTRIRRIIATSRQSNAMRTTAPPKIAEVLQAARRGPRVPRLMRHNGVALRSVTIRRVFALIDEFRLQCNRHAGSEAIAQALAAVVDLAGRALPRTACNLRSGKRLGAENAYCLEELQALLRALQANQMPATFDLCHAMDSLIIQMVRMKPIWTATTRVHAAFRSLAVRSRREGFSMYGRPI